MDIKGKASKAADDIGKEARVLKGEESKDRRYETTRTFDDDDSAAFEFSRCKDRLFDVNRWSDIPGIANSNFKLFDANGSPLERNKVSRGDFIRIDLPGPLPFFWVRVTAVTEEEHMCEFVVQPSYDPTDNDDKIATDHFFQDQARSIFRVERRGSGITAMEIGIQEAINNQGPEAGGKGLVNTLVSEGGWAGLQKYQWKNLTDYVVGIRPAQ